MPEVYCSKLSEFGLTTGRIEKERHVSLKNLEDIFETEGWINTMGCIAENPRLVDEEAVHVFVQDVAEGVRNIVKGDIKSNFVKAIKDLVEKDYFGVNIIFYEGNYTVTASGTGCPPLTLELNKSRFHIDGKSGIYGNITYRQNPIIYTLAQFDIPKEFLRLLK